MLPVEVSGVHARPQDQDQTGILTQQPSGSPEQVARHMDLGSWEEGRDHVQQPGLAGRITATGTVHVHLTGLQHVSCGREPLVKLFSEAPALPLQRIEARKSRLSFGRQAMYLPIPLPPGPARGAGTDVGDHDRTFHVRKVVRPSAVEEELVRGVEPVLHRVHHHRGGVVHPQLLHDVPAMRGHGVGAQVE